jgi:hypothetical protein
VHLGSITGWIPYLMVCVERDESIDVWRLLQSQRDIPAWLRDPPKPAPDRWQLSK